MENPRATIYLDQINHNIASIQKQAVNSKILAVLKADAYGHGAVQVSKHLENNHNVLAFGVSRYPEAIELFEHGISKPILLMEGLNDNTQLEKSAQQGFWLVIESFAQLELIKNIDLDKPIKAWIKFDTGMGRLGFSYDKTKEVLSEVNQLVLDKKLQSSYVIMSHLACADDIINDNNQMQINNFKKIVNIAEELNVPHKFNIEYSLANSAGIFGHPDSHYDWVRPGISLYGSSPLVNVSREELNLKASMVLSTKIISIKHIKQGQTVGYGSTWQAPNDTLVAVLACGYADCYPRISGESSYVYINKKLPHCKIIGRISMDMMTIDCGAFSNSHNLEIGQVVELWGEYISIDAVAQSCNTISNELYCRITKRVEKIYV